MADFPSNLKFNLGSFKEEEDPSVLRTEMERGPPVERVLNRRVIAKFSGTVTFFSKAEIDAFETWYFDTIERIGWFNIRHPRTRQIIQARFIAGKRGELTPITGGFGLAERNLEMEYMR